MSGENEEDLDELPSIIVNCSTRDSCVFVMPSAEALASQRAREQRCERELEELRETEPMCDGVVRITHSDSSGSESEAALAASVCALQVHAATATPASPPRATLASLLAAVRDHLPPDTDMTFIDECLRVSQERNAPTVAAVTEDILSNISSMLICDDNEWSDEEVLCVGAWLCAACVAGVRGRRVAARSLHVLLNDRATTTQVSLLGELLGRAWRDSDVRAEVADVARAGAGGGGARREGGALLADTLVLAALSDILHDDVPSNEVRAVSLEEVPALVGGAWRRLDAGARHSLLRLLGRALTGASWRGAGGEAGGAGQLAAVLDALAAQRAHATHRHSPDQLQVLVGASKLQLLFGAKK